jgi:SAM-dependent methyltransferase
MPEQILPRISKETAVPHSDDQAWLMRGLIEIRGKHITSTKASLMAYDGLHAAGHLVQRESFYKWLVGLLHPCPGQKLLDVSCGQGGILRFAALAGLDGVGLDLSPIAVKRTSESVNGADVNVGDAERLPYGDDAFDYVTNIGSVEHYFHPSYAVQEMSRVLKPDGLACILLPNSFGLLGNILRVWRTGDVFDDGQPLQRYGTPRQWTNLLQENGLCVTRILKYERKWPRTWTDVRWYCLRPHKLVRVVLSVFIPLNLSSFLVYLCNKANCSHYGNASLTTSQGL